MEELKPCPFCKKESVIRNSGMSQRGIDVVCEDNDCRGGQSTWLGYYTTEKAITAWNQRAEDK